MNKFAGKARRFSQTERYGRRPVINLKFMREFENVFSENKKLQFYQSCSFFVFRFLMKTILFLA
jgi:hypothetical protein